MIVKVYIMGENNYYVGECQEVIKNAISEETVEFDEGTEEFVVFNYKAEVIYKESENFESSKLEDLTKDSLNILLKTIEYRYKTDIVVTGTGTDGNVLKIDLLKAIRETENKIDIDFIK